MSTLTFEEEHKKLQTQVAELREALGMVVATLAPSVPLYEDDPLKTAAELVAAVTDSYRVTAVKIEGDSGRTANMRCLGVISAQGQAIELGASSVNLEAGFTNRMDEDALRPHVWLRFLLHSAMIKPVR